MEILLGIWNILLCILSIRDCTKIKLSELNQIPINATRFWCWNRCDVLCIYWLLLVFFNCYCLPYLFIWLSKMLCHSIWHLLDVLLDTYKSTDILWICLNCSIQEVRDPASADQFNLTNSLFFLGFCQCFRPRKLDITGKCDQCKIHFFFFFLPALSLSCCGNNFLLEPDFLSIGQFGERCKPIWMLGIVSCSGALKASLLFYYPFDPPYGSLSQVLG